MIAPEYLEFFLRFQSNIRGRTPRWRPNDAQRSSLPSMPKLEQGDAQSRLESFPHTLDTDADSHHDSDDHNFHTLGVHEESAQDGEDALTAMIHHHNF